MLLKVNTKFGFFMFLGSVPLPDLAKLMLKEELEQLKSECGGLQTLLKNTNHIFKGEMNFIV